MAWLRIQIVNLLFYSNLFIGVCAACIVLATGLILDIEINTSYILFVSFGTIAQYGLHRYIGMSKFMDQEADNRFLVIKDNKTTILFSATISAILCVYFWLTMPSLSRILSIFPFSLSLLYVVPVFANNKRLRDFPFIKIFIIAACWSLFSVTIPMLEAGNTPSESVLLSLERLLFFYAITIPFDIRDYSIDIRNNVSTIPRKIGLKWAKISAYTASIIGSIILVYLGVNVLPAALISVMALFLIYFSIEDRRELYYTGLVDGSIILYFVILYFL